MRERRGRASRWIRAEGRRGQAQQPLDETQGSRHAHAAGTRARARRARTFRVMPAEITSRCSPSNIGPARAALCSRQAVVSVGFGWERPKAWRRGGGCVPWRLRRRASSPAKGLLPHLRTPDRGHCPCFSHVSLECKTTQPGVRRVGGGCRDATWTKLGDQRSVTKVTSQL
jgi:hypothetical protein